MTQLLENIEALCRIELEHAKAGQVQQIFLAKENLLAAAKGMYEAEYFLEDVTVQDVAEGFEAYYHFNHWENVGRITLRVQSTHEDASFPSIASVYQGAEWHERESKDFYNVKFDGIPNDTPLLLDPSMAEAAPLRKDEKKRKSYLDLMPPFTFVEGPDDHPLKALEQERIAAAKKAEEEAKKKAEEEAKKAEEEAAKKAAEAEEKA